MGQLDDIRIKNAVFYAYHGVMVDEQNLGGKFEVDVDMYADLTPAEETDSLKRTVDYERVYKFVRETVLTKKYHLIESLANTIARGIIQEFASVQNVVVRIRKPHPPVKGVVDHIEVEVARQR